MGRSGRSRFAVSLIALIASACGAPKTQLPELPSSEPDEVLRVVRERDDALRSMRSVFTATADHEGRQRKTDGVLVVAKPDRFRLRMMLLNLTVLDYLRVGKEVKAQLPIEDDENAAERGRYLSFARDDFASAFLRGDYAFPGKCRAKVFDEQSVQVTCGPLSDQTTSRVMVVDATTGFIQSEVSYLGATPRMILQYSDYRPVGAFWLPYHIRMTHPREQRSLVIAVSRYEANPTLDDALFE